MLPEKFTFNLFLLYSSLLQHLGCADFFVLFLAVLVQAANSAVVGSVCSTSSGCFTLLIAVEMLVESLPAVVSCKRWLEARTEPRSWVLRLEVAGQSCLRALGSGSCLVWGFRCLATK